MSNKKTQGILYWVFTGLFSFFMLGSAIPDILSVEMAKQGFASIGLPAYLLPFLGWAKTAGVAAILIPGFAKIKEWAYAGLIFDLLGAMYCIAAAGKPASDWAGIILPLTIGFISYFYYRKKLTTQD